MRWRRRRSPCSPARHRRACCRRGRGSTRRRRSELEEAIRLGLATDPARRPATPGELVERLRTGWGAALPTGVMTFCLSDIEGSTAMWDSEPVAMAEALVRHDELIADQVESHGGRFLKSMGEGDSTVSVFDSAPQALDAALAATRALAAESWPGGLRIAARFGIHTGEAERRGTDYFGPTINLAARLRGQADGGQIFLSSVSADLVGARLPEELRARGHRAAPLEGAGRSGADPRDQRARRRCTAAGHRLPVSRPAGLRAGGPRVLLRARGRGAAIFSIASVPAGSWPSSAPPAAASPRSCGPESLPPSRPARSTASTAFASLTPGADPQAGRPERGQRAGDRRPVRGAVHAVPRPGSAARLHRRAARPSRPRGDRRARRPLRPAQHPRRPRPRSRPTTRSCSAR